jgi:hypothetical protein
MAVFGLVAPCRVISDDGSSEDLWNDGKFTPIKTVLKPRRHPSSF